MLSMKKTFIITFLLIAALAFLGLGIGLLMSVGASGDPLASFKRLFTRDEEVIIPVTDSGQTYTVKHGEDLYAVAIRFGVSPSDIKKLNKLPSAQVAEGTVLKIPGDTRFSPPPAEDTEAARAPAPEPAAVTTGPTQTYTVKHGEDLYAVAIRFGVSPADLRALNKLTSTDLTAGTVLKIPEQDQ